MSGRWLSRNWPGLVIGPLLVVAALALRLPQLDRRPMHGDEAVHAIKFGALLTTGRYVYDPHEYHGPTLYYLSLPIAWLGGARSLADLNESDLRLLPVLAGIGLLLVLPLVADGLGRVGTIAAGLLTAVSPALVYYNRYYIQESLLVFFTALAVGAGWRYVQRRRLGWAILAGVAIGCAQATKETFLIVFFALAGALALMYIRNRGQSAQRHHPAYLGLCAGVLAAVLASVVLYSSFLANRRGPVDAFRAVLTYAERSGGATHAHPWYFYGQRLLYFHYPGAPDWTEGAIVILATVGGVGACASRSLTPPLRLFSQFVTFFTVLLAATYSIIPYKTPWCFLGVVHSLTWLAGFGAAWIWQSLRAPPGRGLLAATLFVAAFFAAAGHLAYQAWQAAVPFAADHRNPYAYAHPVPDVQNLAAWLERLAAAAPPDGHRTRIHVIAPNPWPLPWYLRRFERVGYWEAPPADANADANAGVVIAPAAEADADVVIATPEFWSKIEPTLRQRYQTSVYGLRPAEGLVVAVATPLYERFERSPLAAPEPTRADPNRADPNRVDPNRAEPNRAEPNRAEPNRARQEAAPASTPPTTSRP